LYETHNTYPGKFLLDNYKQALELVTTLTPALTTFKDTHSLTDADFLRFVTEEKVYLASLKLPPVNSLAVSYVKSLEAFESAQ
jgi:hypothetical protein